MDDEGFYNEYCHDGYQLIKNDLGVTEIWIEDKKVFSDIPKSAFTKDGGGRPDPVTKIGLDGFRYKIDFLHDGTICGVYRIRSD